MAFAFYVVSVERNYNLNQSRVPPRLGLCCFLSICMLAAQSTQTPDSKPPAASPADGVTAPPVPLPQTDPASALAPLLRQFVQVLATVESQSADAGSVDKLVFEGAIPSMLRQLDPHTQFFDPVQFQQLRQMEDSEQKGFGSIVSVLPGQVIFLQTLPGTPSNKAGIQAGDELVAVNNIGIRSLEPQQIIQLLTEARQQKVTVFVRRQGSAKLLDFTLTPELVDSPSVDRAFVLEPGYGYIRIASWDLQTSKQFRSALDTLDANQLKGLVLDLRNNPGGVVRAALDAASMFLQPGERILTAKGRGTSDQSADVPKSAHPYQFKLAVLINQKTASASEILSGALQDHDRAVILGEPSYGKGLVQSVLPLSDGAGLAITTAFYYTPSGRSIQRPLRNSALSETFNANTPKPTYKTDKGRIVKGGGGIQPDILVTPASLTPLEAVLDGSGALMAFATEYLAGHPAPADPFHITPETIDEFKVFLAARRIQPNIAEWTNERPWLSNHLKQEIFTQARGVDKGDEIQAQFDPQIQAALKALHAGALLAER